MSAPRDPGRALADLRAPLQAGIVAPPFEQIRGRARRRRRRRAAGGGLLAAALVLGGALAVPTLAGRHPGAPSSVQVAASVGPTVAGAPSAAGLSADDSTLLADGTGLVLGQRCQPPAGCRVELLGGQSLDRISELPGSPTPAGGQPVATRIANVTSTPMLYAYDPGLYISGDEGSTWTDVSPAGRTVVDVAPSRSNVWLLTTAASGAARIEQSGVGGTQPHLLATVPDSDASARLLRPTDTLALVPVADLGRIEVSSDSGANWSTRSMPAGCSTGASLSVTVNAATWWLLCPGTSGAVTVWSSQDGGVQWMQLTAPTGIGRGAVLTAVGTRLAYVSGGSAGLFATRDGGHVWTRLLADGSGVFGQPHVQYTHPDATWVTDVRVSPAGQAVSQVWHSADGGLTWTSALLQ